jgi:hypothetical protein
MTHPRKSRLPRALTASGCGDFFEHLGVITTGSISFVKCSPALVPSDSMDDKLTPADPRDTADSVAFALLFSGKKRVHDSDRFMASIVAQRIVAHLERCGYVILKKPPIGGSDPLNKPPGWPHTSREKSEMSG